MYLTSPPTTIKVRQKVNIQAEFNMFEFSVFTSELVIRQFIENFLVSMSNLAVKPIKNVPA